MNSHLTVLGSPFDPPHLGHLWMARQTLQYTPADQIWLTPTGRHPFGKLLSPAKHRRQMAQLLSRLHPNFHLHGWELEQNQPSYMFDTLTHLKQAHPRDTISLLIGSDNLVALPRWHRYRDLLDQFTILVFPRPGYPLNLTHPHLQAVTHPHLITTNISSTIIKQLTAHHQPIDPFLPVSISKYIHHHHLYDQT